MDEILIWVKLVLLVAPYFILCGIALVIDIIDIVSWIRGLKK